MAIDTSIYDRIYWQQDNAVTTAWSTNSPWVSVPATPMASSGFGDVAYYNDGSRLFVARSGQTTTSAWTVTTGKYDDLWREIIELGRQKQEEPKDEEIDDEALGASMNEMFEDIFADEDTA